MSSKEFKIKDKKELQDKELEQVNGGKMIIDLHALRFVLTDS